jgi:DNA invertase Pin-like site-specific DNA recombinase
MLSSTDRLRPAPLRSEKGQPWHRDRLAAVYIRQSTPQQVRDHQAATRRQDGLVTRAQALGWPAARVLVLDEALGKSGTSTEGRVGFQRLVSAGSLDHVGLILGSELSRLARSHKDWPPRLEWWALFSPLIADLDGVYEPVHYHDRLLLGRKGTLREAELHVLTQRRGEGRLSTGRRGAFTFALPIGYGWQAPGTIACDPDEQGQAVGRLSFAKFAELGTLGGVLRYLVQHAL